MFYFLLKPYIKPTQANYQHACIVFAEGLLQHKKQFWSNIDYFPDQKGGFLFNNKPLEDLNMITYIVTAHPEDFKEKIIKLNETKKYYVIIFDSKDEWVRPQSTNLLYLANRYFMTTSKVITDRIKPLCFAISNRMIEVSKQQPQIKWSDRSEEIFWSHRVDNHRLRNIVMEFYDKSKTSYHKHLDNFEQPEGNEALHYWSQTGRRHNPSYFAELHKYKYMDAHGGYDTRDGNIVQWDSWKIWEGLLAGMLVITADLDFYNIKLPFKLQPYVHYIPVKYSHIPDAYATLKRLSDSKKAEIASEGQKFVLEHFCPKSMAKYILENLQSPDNQNK
jgi:hypothetical protein